MGRVWRRFVCVVRGHDPVKQITGLDLTSGSVVVGGGSSTPFRATAWSVWCRRCGARPADPRHASTRKGARW